MNKAVSQRFPKFVLHHPNPFQSPGSGSNVHRDPSKSAAGWDFQDSGSHPSNILVGRFILHPDPRPSATASYAPPHTLPWFPLTSSSSMSSLVPSCIILGSYWERTQKWYQLFIEQQCSRLCAKCLIHFPLSGKNSSMRWVLLFPLVEKEAESWLWRSATGPAVGKQQWHDSSSALHNSKASFYVMLLPYHSLVWKPQSHILWYFLDVEIPQRGNF